MDAEAYGELELRLVGLSRSKGPLRAALAEISSRLVATRTWEPFGYARLSNYADERIGRSARSLQDLARVGDSLRSLPHLRDALIRGELGWTKTRLVARVATSDDEARWIAYAQQRTSADLSREVRRIDQGSVERAGYENDRRRESSFEIPCTVEVRYHWHRAVGAARKVYGGWISPTVCAELIAAEVLSALPLDPDLSGNLDVMEPSAPVDSHDSGANAGEVEAPSVDCECTAEARPGATLPETIQALLNGMEDVGAMELDRRLQAAVGMEQRLDAEIGPLLELVVRRRFYWLLGYRNREAYVRERLGLEPSWGRALLRIERAARASPCFARAYRRGELSALQAAALVPLVHAELAERWLTVWVEHAPSISLRQLREDVDAALLLCETDFEAWQRTGGLRGADESKDGAESGDGIESAGNRCAHSAPGETCSVEGPIDWEVAKVFRAVLSTVRRRMERETGRLPTRGEALGAMLEHVLAEWRVDDVKVQRRHAIFARDAWRCVVPGCTSMRNLQDHHIVFRSAGGSDEPSNRVTLCAWHHLRGVHQGIVRITGHAPDRLRFEVGVRPDGSPIAVYASGDRVLRISSPRP